MRRIVARLRDPGSVGSIMLRGGVVSLGLIVVGTGLGLATNLLLARMLTAADYGVYAIATGWALMLAIPATAGFDFVVLRFAPAYLAEGRGDLLRNLVRTAVCLVVALAAVTGIGFHALNLALPGLLGIPPDMPTHWLALLSGASALLVVLSSLFRARRKIFLSQFYQQVLRSAVLLGLTFVVARHGGLDAGRAIAITALAALVAAILLGLHLFLTGNRERQAEAGAAARVLEGTEIRAARRSWWGMAMPSLLSSATQQLLMQAGILVLGIVSTTEQAAGYALAARLTLLVTFPLSALASITAPMIVEAWNAGDRSRLQQIASMNARLAVLCAVVPTVLYAVAGQAVLGAFGPQYLAAFPALLALSLGGLAAAFTGASASLLLMTGRQSLVARLMLAAAAGQVAILFPLAALFGATGAGLAVCLTTVCLNAAMSRLVARHMGVDANAIRLRRR
jgi:O-antigen/teichoic acid export membrane protein